MDLHRTLIYKYCPDKINDSEYTFSKCVWWKSYKSSTEEIIDTLGSLSLEPGDLYDRAIGKPVSCSSLRTANFEKNDRRKGPVTRSRR
ncbi:hypothetical protein J6590_106802, partial [Homalodisca vitripennis]